MTYLAVELGGSPQNGANEFASGGAPHEAAPGISALQPPDRVLTFYLRCLNGTASSFFVADIGSDEMAVLFALQLFAGEEAVESIDVFDGDTPVFQGLRPPTARAPPR
jgi:hypothetical protein